MPMTTSGVRSIFGLRCTRRVGSGFLALAAALSHTPALAGVPQYSQAVLADAPVAYWRLGEAAGPTALDAAGPFNGVYGPGVTPGQSSTPLLNDPDTSALFSGAAGARVTVPYSAALNPDASGFTIEAWARPEGGSGFRAVVSNRNDLASNQAGYILYAGPADGAAGDRWQFWTGGNETNTYNFQGRNRDGYGLGPTVTLNAWTHIVGTFQVTSGPDVNGLYTGTQSMYVNGALALSRPNTRLRVNPSRDFFIGAGQNEAPDALRWTGKIDEVAFYNRALSASEVSEHFMAGVSAFGPWQSIYAGVQVAQGQSTAGGTRALRVSALRIRLAQQGLSFLATPGNGADPLDTTGQTASQFLVQYGVQAAINTSFFAPCCNAANEPKDLIGFSSSNGAVVSDPVTVTTSAGSAVVSITQDNRASIVSTAGAYDLSESSNAGPGSWIILQDGQNIGATHPTGFADPLNPNPRSAAGISQDGAYLYLMTIDGRQPGYSDGASVVETAQWLARIGAWRGLNLDGGGSTALVRADGAGGATQINRPVHNNIPGTERHNASHLGVFAPALCQGDADGNRQVNFADVTSALSNFGTGGPLGDADFDGDIDFSDITRVLSNFGVPCP